MIVLFNPWSTPSPKKPLPMSLLAVGSTLEGEFEIGLADGSTHRFGPGHVTLAEDLTGKGHTTRVVGNKRRLTATIHLAD